MASFRAFLAGAFSSDPAEPLRVDAQALRQLDAALLAEVFRAKVVDAAVDAVTAGLGGAISAEHGIGRAKRAWLPRQRGAEQVALMRRIKAAWDPAGLLNPGALVDGAASGENGRLQ